MHNGKYGLLSLLNHYRLTMISLSHKANVPVSTIQSIAWGIAVQKEVAEHVLDILSKLTRVHYTLDNVDVAIFVDAPQVTMVEED